MQVVSLERVMMRRRMVELCSDVEQLLVTLGVLSMTTQGGLVASAIQSTGALATCPIGDVMRRRMVELCSDMEQLVVTLGVLSVIAMRDQVACPLVPLEGVMSFPESVQVRPRKRAHVYGQEMDRGVAEAHSRSSQSE